MELLNKMLIDLIKEDSELKEIFKNVVKKALLSSLSEKKGIIKEFQKEVDCLTEEMLNDALKEDVLDEAYMVVSASVAKEVTSVMKEVTAGMDLRKLVVDSLEKFLEKEKASPKGKKSKKK